MAETKVIIKGENATDAAFRQVERNFDRFAEGMKRLAGPIALLSSATGVAALVKNQIELGDQLSKTSQKLHVSVEDLSAYQYAAKLSGVSNEELTGTLAKLAKNIHEAGVDKTSEAARYFNALGIAVTDASGKSRDTGSVFEQLAKRLAAAGEDASRTAIEIKLFGKSGYELAPLINNLAALKVEAADTGNIVSTKFAKQAEQFNDNLLRMEASSGKLARTLTMHIVPAMNDWIESLNVAAGAQDRLSLGALENRLTSLQQRYEQLREEKKHAIVIGEFHKTGLGRETAEIVFQISQLQNLTTLEKNRQEARRQISGENDKKPLPGLDAFRDPAIAAKAEELRRKLKEKELTDYYDFISKKEEADQKALEQLSAHLMSATELENQNYNERLALLATAETEKISTLVPYQQLREQLEKQHQDKLIELEDAALRKRFGAQKIYRQFDAESAGAFFGQMANLMQGTSKKQFEIGKKAAIAQTIINTYEAAVAAFVSFAKIPIVGTVLGAAAAAAAISMGLSNVQRISAQQFEGGGAGGGAVGTFPASPNTGLPTGGSGPPPAAPGEASSGGQTTIQIMGNVYAGSQALVDYLVQQLSDAINNRDVVIIGQNSRQARDLTNFAA
jgi:hypothetical protein